NMPCTRLTKKPEKKALDKKTRHPSRNASPLSIYISKPTCHLRACSSLNTCIMSESFFQPPKIARQKFPSEGALSPPHAPKGALQSKRNLLHTGYTISSHQSEVTDWKTHTTILQKISYVEHFFPIHSIVL
ncbi:hypothetical protein GOP47_0013075, partial [Adiantum capillus-veneris]